MSTVPVVVDGIALTLRCSPGTNLQRALWDAGVRSVKSGCEEGECGSCTVLLDGSSVCACLVPAVACAGTTIETATTLASAELTEAVARLGGVQCGFCTPGFVVSISSFVAEARASHHTPNRADVCEALAGNLCRCTGYQALIDAVCELVERDA